MPRDKEHIDLPCEDTSRIVGDVVGTFLGAASRSTPGVIVGKIIGDETTKVLNEACESVEDYLNEPEESSPEVKEAIRHFNGEPAEGSMSRERLD